MTTASPGRAPATPFANSGTVPRAQRLLLSAANRVLAACPSAPHATECGWCDSDDPCDSCLQQRHDADEEAHELARVAQHLPVLGRFDRLLADCSPEMLAALQSAAFEEHQRWAAQHRPQRWSPSACACGASLGVPGPLCRLYRLLASLAEVPASPEATRTR